MPLLGKKAYKPSPLPKDLKSEEEIFVIKETNEVFRSYDEYVNRIILYGFQVWSCQLTGKTNLKYGEAVACEEQALKRLEGFPKYFEKPVLQIVHHSSSGLQTLAQHCYKHLEKEYVENESVMFCASGKWHQGIISKVNHKNITSNVSENISSTSSSPSNDKENLKVKMPGSGLEKNAESLYDIKCDSTSDCMKDVQSGDIKRVKKLPSVEMLKCFIRANTENPWTNDNSPWLVKTELAKKYSLFDKLKDFSLVVKKKTTPTPKTPKEGAKSSEKPKKRLLDESGRHGKTKVNKIDPSQRKLDSFRKSTGNISKITDKITVTPSKASSVKLSRNSPQKRTPVKQDLVEVCSSPEMDDGIAPSGKLRGTPIKCRLVLTPVKSPRSGTGKSHARKQSNVKGGTKTKTDLVVEDNTNDVSIIKCKSPKAQASQSVKKLKKPPKSDKSKKTLEGTEELKQMPVKDVKSSKKLNSVSTHESAYKDKGKELSIDRSKSEQMAKAPNAEDVVQRTESVDLTDDSENEFVTPPANKLKATVTPIKVKQSAGKMKQTTLFDLTKKPEDEKAVPSKKQKTVAEMFNTALQLNKRRALAKLIRKSAQTVSSPSSLNLNLSTPQRDLVEKKWHAHKMRLERQLHKTCGTQQGNMKQEDTELVNLKPLPPAKPVNIPDGITVESYSDVVMLAEFVHTFRDLLLPKETLHISTDNLSEALTSGSVGFPLLSRILVIFLQILLQERSTKGIEVGMQLSEMPVTQQTASEVSRLYLNSKLQILTAHAEDRQLQGILESLQSEELYNLTPEEKLKILMILCHEVLASDALDDYTESFFTQATELRKQKMAKQKDKNNKLREVKEREKKEKEELQKQKEEEEGRTQLTLDELNKKEETESTCASSEAIQSNPSPDNSKIDKQKATKDVTKENEDVSDVVKTMRQRREDMANKQERKLKEGKERLAKDDEEHWDINMAQCLTQCQYTLRLNPIGYDRNNARYWVFNGAAPGVYVEQGWRNLECLSQRTEVSKEIFADEEVGMETDGNEQAPGDDGDVELVEEAKDDSKMGSYENEAQEPSLPDVPYSWSCYNTEDEIWVLRECLSQQGIRESALRISISQKMTCITDGIRRSSNNCKPTKPETGEEDLFSSIKEELISMTKSLVNGNLAVLDDDCLEKYQQTVDQASCMSDLASQLEKLLLSVLPQFYQGMFSKDKNSSDKAKQCWLEQVKKATTVSRLHLLLGILDSTVIWDLSAENVGCKVCRNNGADKTLILCDDCNLGFHLQCLRPALSEVPEGHWSCPVCKPNMRQSSRSRTNNYKEESSSEAGDKGEEASDASLGDFQDSSSEDESDHHEDYCHTCGEDGDLICCDTCPLVFHTDCHQPALRNIPRGAWSCWQCRQPKNKKKKGKQRVSHSTKSKAAKNKGGKRAMREESSQGKSKRKRSRSLSSDESGHQKVSKRTRQRRQPIIVQDDSARSTRRRTRVSIEDDEEDSESNVKSFYGRSSRRTRQQKVSYDDSDCNDDDGDRKPARGIRSHKQRILDDSNDDDEENETEEKEYHKTSKRKNASRPKKPVKPARRSTRSQRRVSSSSEESDDGDEDISRPTNQRATRNKTKGGSKKVSSSFDESEESGRDTSRRSTSKRRALSEKYPEKSSKGTVKTNSRGRRGKENSQDEDETVDGNEKGSNKKMGKERKQTRGELKNRSATKDGQKETRKTRRTEAQEDSKDKRRRVNLEMNACEKIVQDLLGHEDCWPFAEAVNLQEVPDYLELVTTPMDLDTIREKLKCLEYPDVESFVADVRLVFSNSDKYNLDTSDVGIAAKNLEKYFDKLVKHNFSNVGKKSKVQRKR